MHDYYASTPDASGLFNSTMAALSAQTAPDLIDVHTWDDHRLIVDVGGGLGITLAAILRRHPRPQGIVYDRPHVAAAARQEVDRLGLASRCQVVAGDARTAVPTGDAYLFRMVLCDFPDRDAEAMLAACRRAVRAGGRLIIIDKLRPPRARTTSNARTLMSALNLMVMTGSTERTELEYPALLETSGWRMLDLRATSALGGELHCLRAAPR